MRVFTRGPTYALLGFLPSDTAPPAISWGERAGHRVTLADPPISGDEAQAELAAWIRVEVLPYVLRLCPGLLPPERLGAILDWTYNLGWPNLRASTLRRKINAGSWGEVPAEILKWDRGGGRQLKGLTWRRVDEVALWKQARA